MQTSEQTNEISAALAKAQAELENVGKGAVNPHFRSKYATLADVLSEVRPKFAAQGIAILQMPVNGEGQNIGVITRFTHSSGQWIESALYIAPLKFDAQGVGSVLTYGRRYSLMAMAGIGADDDDGNAAVARPTQRPNGETQPFPLDAESIDGDQLKELTDLADEVGADKARFCSYLKVPSFADIPASQYQKAKAALESKRGAAK